MIVLSNPYENKFYYPGNIFIKIVFQDPLGLFPSVAPFPADISGFSSCFYNIYMNSSHSLLYVYCIQ